MQIDSANVILKLEQKTQCSDCKSRCSDGFLSFLFRGDNQGVIKVALTNRTNGNSHLMDKQSFFNGQHKKDDIVGIKFKESQLFIMALYLYGLPIVLILLSLLLGYYSFQNYNLNPDIGGVLGFAIGLLLSKVVIQLKNNKIKPNVSFFK